MIASAQVGNIAYLDGRYYDVSAEELKVIRNQARVLDFTAEEWLNREDEIKRIKDQASDGSKKLKAVTGELERKIKAAGDQKDVPSPQVATEHKKK